MDSETFVGFLQFTDGLFPAGSYAHSFGLEFYVADGTVHDADGVESFLRTHLQNSVAPTDVVAMLAAREAALQGGTAGWRECLRIDGLLDAMKAPSETRDASRQMGRQVLRIAANLSETLVSRGLAAELLRAVTDELTAGHHAMAFGAVGGAFGWPEPEMACAYAYSACAGLVAAALRLLPIGQSAGQRILWNLRPAAARFAEEAQQQGLEGIWSFAPALEIAAMRHAQLDARLFRS